MPASIFPTWVTLRLMVLEWNRCLVLVGWPAVVHVVGARVPAPPLGPVTCAPLVGTGVVVLCVVGRGVLVGVERSIAWVEMFLVVYIMVVVR